MKCRCPHCATAWQVQGLTTGQRLSCPRCSTKIIIRTRKSDTTAEIPRRFDINKRTLALAAIALVGVVACVAILEALLSPRAVEEAVVLGNPATARVATGATQEEPARPIHPGDARDERLDKTDGHSNRPADRETLAPRPSLPVVKPTAEPESREVDSRQTPALDRPVPLASTERSEEKSSSLKVGRIPEIDVPAKPEVAPLPVRIDPVPTPTPPLPKPKPAQLPKIEPGLVTFMGSPARGKRFVILADASGSMSGARFAAVKAEIARTLTSASPDMAVSLIFFANHPLLVPDGWVQGGPNVTEALNWVATIRARGETKPLPAFDLAFSLHPRPDAIFFLTDGELPANVSHQVAALNRASRIPIHTIQVGGTGSSASLASLARDSGGTYRNVFGQRR